ncbi:MarR family transcriptional regulator [Halobacteria archaeon AArc-curdl1]|uniref:MarR family transcriptional regulator n=1 Tax=Natronosalvus hydrolyticus TaxID=2979988 RepID=A0AAP2ZBU3_9EURY|nr:MarR family transcriptional regulator [Halobacteria archaeon AArc-curdl1]
MSFSTDTQPVESTTDNALEDLPPSAKLVYKVLEYEGAMTQGELARASRLCSRTVRYAITKLEANEVIASRVSLADARRSIYWIPDDSTDT